MTELSSPDLKAALRRRALANRSSLAVDHARVCTGLRRFFSTAELGTGNRTGWILVFDAMPGEANVSALFDDVPERPLAITRTPEAGRVLTIHDGRAPRERHAYGYTQPLADSPTIDDSEVSVVLVPGLAFDRMGGRLGFGAGFYDRLLSRLGPDVIRIGMSDGFIVDRVPMDEHDVAMTHLATEAGVMKLPLEPTEY